jgi:uncharacterized heparinase superfamily protein
MIAVLQRLRRMSSDEIGSRSAALLHRTLDRGRVRAGGSRWRRHALRKAIAPAGPLAPVAPLLARSAWLDAHRAIAAHLLARPPRFLVHASIREALAARITERRPGAVADAVRLADTIVRGEYELLGYSGLRFASAPEDTIDWQLDPVSGRRSPRVFWADVPYLDPACGDHKVIWELNRHQHWLQLGRAAWLSGDRRFRTALVRELESWMAANPPLVGINWSSALEIAFRTLSWTWAAELFADDAGSDDTPWLVDLLLGLDRQLRHLERNLSWYFSPNTHLLGEALALYVCGQVWPELRRSPRWIALGRGILIQQTGTQVLPDGVHAERSPHYHRYALDFYLMALSVAGLCGDRALVDAVDPVARRMTAALGAFADARGHMPLIGDDDGGELAPVAGRAPYDAAATLAWADALLERRGPRPDAPEAALWLTATTRLHAESRASVAIPPRSVVLASSGYHISRLGRSVVVFDAGAHGFLNGGHAHADALSVTITVGGVPLAVDPGTGTYTMDRVARDRFRATAAHNTLVLDGRSQSEPAGPFKWRTQAAARSTHGVLNPEFDYFEGDTDAYAPAVHERRVLALGDDRWIIADRVLGGGRHDAAVHWHLAPEWTAAPDEGRTVRLRHSSGATAAIAVPDTTIQVFRDDEATGLGRVAPVYGRILPSTTLRCSATRQAPFWIVSLIDAGDGGAGQPRSEIVPVLCSDPRDAVAVLTRRHAGCSVTLLADGGRRESSTVELEVRQQLAVTTDARLLHADIDEIGDLTHLVLVDATFARYEGPTGRTITAEETIGDVAIAFDRHGGWSARASTQPRGLAVLTDPRPPRPRPRPVRAQDTDATDRGQQPCVESQASPTR